jgi:HPt (histidine-containing phosphotransfer) domain-containing protein
MLRVYGMSDELRELQREYLTDVTRKVAQIREHGRTLAADFKDAFPRLLFLAHQLKGSGGSFGFPRITELAQRMRVELSEFLDDEVASRPTPDELMSKLDRISHELESEVASAQRSVTA